jgi:uncharacterized membrane protein
MKNEKPAYERGVFFRGKGTHPAVIAVWAAIIATGNLLPAIPIVGTSGTFNVGAALVPLAGVFFGPVAGALCAAIGAFIAQILAPHSAWLGLATFVVATTNAFVAGCLSRGRWYLSAGVILLGYALWFSTAIGRQAAVFPLVFYSLGLLAVLAGAVLWKAGGSKGPAGFFLACAVFTSAYAGFVGAAGVANFAGILLYKWPAAMWKGLVFVSPVERALFSFGAAVIGIPLLIGLPKIGVRVGPEGLNKKAPPGALD